MISRAVLRAAAVAAAFLTVSGCAFMEPYESSRVWYPRSSNEGNLAAQVIDPNDLVRGKESATGDGVLAAAAVDRLYRDKVKDLPTGSFSSQPAAAVSTSGGGSGDAQGGN